MEDVVPNWVHGIGTGSILYRTIPTKGMVPEGKENVPTLANFAGKVT